MQGNKPKQQNNLWDQTFFFLLWEYFAKCPVNGRNEVLTKVIWVYVTWHTGLYTETTLKQCSIGAKGRLSPDGTLWHKVFFELKATDIL